MYAYLTGHCLAKKVKVKIGLKKIRNGTKNKGRKARVQICCKIGAETFETKNANLNSKK